MPSKRISLAAHRSASGRDAEGREDAAGTARVLVVAPQPFFEERGTPIAVLQVIQVLLLLGHEVELVTYPIGRTVELPGLRYFRGGNPLGFDHVPIGFSMRKLVLDAALVPTLVERLRRPYTYIHAVEEAAFPVAFFAGGRGVPILYDMQSRLPDHMSRLPGARNRLSRRVMGRMERWLLDRVDLVVTSRGLGANVDAGEVREWNYPSEVGEVSPNRTSELRERLGLRSQDPVIAYVGSFAPYQGVPRLVEAASAVLDQFPEARFLLVGGSADELKQLEASLKRHRVRERFAVLGRQPRQDIDAFLAMADVLVSPRAFGDNLPLKIFDYVAAGRPIVATDIPAHRSVLTEKTATLVPASVGGLARGIISVLQDPASSRARARAARKYAAQELGWLPFVEDVRDMLRVMGCPEPTGNGG